MDPSFFPGQPFIGPHGDDLWWLHGLFTLLAVIAVVVGVVVIVRLLLERRQQPAAAPRHQAVEELDLRYARGEVDRAEYLQRRADLLERSAVWTGGPSG